MGFKLIIRRNVDGDVLKREGGGGADSKVDIKEIIWYIPQHTTSIPDNAGRSKRFNFTLPIDCR